MYKIIRNVFNLSLAISRRNIVDRIQFMRTSPNFKSKKVSLWDEDLCENSTENIHQNVNKFTKRTHNCGELNISNVGERVTLCGWLQYQRLQKFIILRDSYGEIQLMINDNDLLNQKVLQNSPLESIIEVTGTVLSRPADMKNNKQLTGEVEVVVENLKILNKAKTNLPFNIREFQKAKEGLRMQYRYLDLRFPLMQRNLRVRSEMVMKMREFLINQCGFVDVETPTLFKKTPGGAQEFIVPTRFPGQFYSLVQSPQQFKQMLMAGAIDRYFQIARCYRDEGSRPDRQPEFSQLDLEMSFTDVNGILQVVEDLLGHSWPRFLGKLPKVFPRMSYEDAMQFYGTDQPDTRFDFNLHKCSKFFELNSHLESSDNFGSYCLLFPKEYAAFPHSLKDSFSKLAKQHQDVKFVQTKVKNHTDFTAKMNKLVGDGFAQALHTQLDVHEDSILFLAYGDKYEAMKLLGKIRIEYVNHLEKLGLTIRKQGMHLLWVVDFPLFEAGSTPGTLNTVHHPFTSPHPDDVNLLETDPFKVRALSFDLVLNGNEIGGGSVRIHDPSLQETIFNKLNIDKASMQHIIDMLGSGCPPHGGIALGLDRILSKILNTTSIRDVIAFPKTFEGRDPLSGAPSKISEEEMKLYHVKSTQ